MKKFGCGDYGILADVQGGGEDGGDQAVVGDNCCRGLAGEQVIDCDAQGVCQSDDYKN